MWSRVTAPGDSQDVHYAVFAVVPAAIGRGISTTRGNSSHLAFHYAVPIVTAMRVSGSHPRRNSGATNTCEPRAMGAPMPPDAVASLDVNGMHIWFRA